MYISSPCSPTQHEFDNESTIVKRNSKRIKTKKQPLQMYNIGYEVNDMSNSLHAQDFIHCYIRSVK